MLSPCGKGKTTDPTIYSCNLRASTVVDWIKNVPQILTYPQPSSVEGDGLVASSVAETSSAVCCGKQRARQKKNLSSSIRFFQSSNSKAVRKMKNRQKIQEE